jgi:hypothetical protein
MSQILEVQTSVWKSSIFITIFNSNLTLQCRGCYYRMSIDELFWVKGQLSLYLTKYHALKTYRVIK